MGDLGNTKLGILAIGLIVFGFIFLVVFKLFDQPISLPNRTYVLDCDHERNYYESVFRDGYIQLEKGNLNQAQSFFYEYHEHRPEDIKGSIALSHVLIDRCRTDTSFCKSALEYLHFTRSLQKYPDDQLYNPNIAFLGREIKEALDMDNY